MKFPMIFPLPKSVTPKEPRPQPGYNASISGWNISAMRRGWRHLAVEKVQNDENPWDGMDGMDGMGWPIFSDQA